MRGGSVIRFAGTFAVCTLNKTTRPRPPRANAAAYFNAERACGVKSVGKRMFRKEDMSKAVVGCQWPVVVFEFCASCFVLRFLWKETTDHRPLVTDPLFLRHFRSGDAIELLAKTGSLKHLVALSRE